MCGIVGQVNRNARIDKSIFLKMRDSLAHRGPDDFSDYYDDSSNLAFGHRRLSIIDLSVNGRQPMLNEDDSIVISFNGEIYNYREIKSELQAQHYFKSTTDTEVIMHAYEEWGIEATLKKMNGMFAFALYDKKRGKVICARDRVGIKPLVYYVSGNTFIFASEIKAVLLAPEFKKELNCDAVRDYFLYRYVPFPGTIYRKMFKLEPGHYFTFDIDRFQIDKRKYWDVREKYKVNADDEEKVVEVSGALLEASVKKRLRADVNVDTFLSGGIDSSLITALAKKHSRGISGFSIRVKVPEKDELASAKYVAEKLDVPFNYKELGPEEFNRICDKVIGVFDEPLADTSIIPTFLLCENASKRTKVALAGDGGDEVFYGYRWYDEYNKSTERKKGNSFEVYRNTVARVFTFEQVRDLLNCRIEEAPGGSSHMFRSRMDKGELEPEDLGVLDFMTFMVDDCLTKVDMVSMANSLEVRVPYLDHDLVEYVMSVPHAILYKERERKYLLKTIARGKLPRETIDKPKKGFSSPTIRWLEKDLASELLEGRAVADGVMNAKVLRNILKEEKSEEKLWLLYVFEKWYARNMNNGGPRNGNLVDRIKNWVEVLKFKCRRRAGMERART